MRGATSGHRTTSGDPPRATSHPSKSQQTSLRRHQRLRPAADASAILLAALKVLAWYFLSPEMFRSETTNTLIVPVQQVDNEDRTLCDGVSINITVTPLSVRSLSKIAHIYRLIVTGVVGNPAGASVSIKALELRCPPSDRVRNGSLSAIGSSCQIAKFSSSQACIVLGAAGAGTGEIQLNCSLAVLEWRVK